MIPKEAVELQAIADQVNRLALLHGDPERFHLEKDEAVRRLRRAARLLIQDTGRKPSTTWRPGDDAKRRLG